MRCSWSRQVSSDPALEVPFLAEKRELVPFAVSQPGGLLLWLTIPNVKLQPRRYFSSFFMSMMWLSATAYVVCIGSDRINILWGIPRSFLGLTLVAIGTSWPNLLASIVTARPDMCHYRHYLFLFVLLALQLFVSMSLLQPSRQGRGEMAISSALGSNVQNIFFVLAFPIFISVLARGDYTSNSAEILSSVLWIPGEKNVAVLL